MVCPMALSWGQSYLDYTLLHSAKLFKIILHLTHKHVTESFDRLKNLDDIKNGFFANKLKLNPDKTKFILFG